MILSGKSLLLLLLTVFSWNTGNAQNLFNANKSKKFAQYLVNTQQYHLAATEYERILSLEKTDTAVYSGLLKTYRMGKICENSFENLNTLEVYKFFSNNILASEYLKLALTCNCCFQESHFSEALSSVDYNRQVFYKLGYYLLSEQKDSLNLLTFHNYNFLSKSYPEVLKGIKDIQSFKRKSPGLAITMSAIIPGSGKAYSSYWGDAVMSFIFVSTNAWLSYRGFNKNGIKSANGWIFGSISLGFYVGNIWGSGRAVKTYNQIEYQKLYNEAKNDIYNHF